MYLIKSSSNQIKNYSTNNKHNRYNNNSYNNNSYKDNNNSKCNKKSSQTNRFKIITKILGFMMKITITI